MNSPDTDPRDAVIARLSVENEKLRKDLTTLYEHAKLVNKLVVEVGRKSDLYDVHLVSGRW